MSDRHPARGLLLLSLVTAGMLAGCKKEPAPGPDGKAPPYEVTLLNASYDPTRELYQAVNAAFADAWAKEHGGQKVTVNQSHGGSGKQARAVIDGLEADVVTLALAYDVDQIHQKGQLIPADWQSRLPHNASPYTSTIVLVVRKGNPKGIKDWEDLTRPGVQVVTPNPKTSGGARWNYLAAWGSALKKHQGDEAKAKELVVGIYKNTPVLDAGARGATTTFSERNIGDVFIAWEDEALLLTRGANQDRYELVIPSFSIRAEPPVTVVDKNVDKKGTRAVAEAYLKFLYSEAGQEIAAKHFYRPRLTAVAEKYKAQFAPVELFTIDELFGGWNQAQKTHFDEGGLFDQLYKPSPTQ
jgi:sulfate/thiosulfate-binding protein